MTQTKVQEVADKHRLLNDSVNTDSGGLDWSEVTCTIIIHARAPVIERSIMNLVEALTYLKRPALDSRQGRSQWRVHIKRGPRRIYWLGDSPTNINV